MTMLPLNMASPAYNDFVSSGRLVTESWEAIGPTKGCTNDKAKLCTGFTLSGLTTVSTDKSGKTQMTIDAMLGWKA
jgi:hypothetical protein